MRTTKACTCVSGIVISLVMTIAGGPAWAQDEEPAASVEPPTVAEPQPEETAPSTAPSVVADPETAPTPETSPEAPAPAPAPPWYEGIQIGGMVDAYFGVNFNQLDGDATFRSNQFRNFDLRTNEASLSYVELVVSRKAAPVGFRFDLGFGPTADLVHASEALPGAMPTPVASFNNLQQAYVTYVVPVGRGLTVDIGKTVTMAGAEVIESKDNWNYSRSFLFSWAIPYYHTGVRATLPLSKELSASLSVLNGWNNVIDNNNGKSAHFNLTYLKGSVAAYLNYIGGPELRDDDHLRHLVDATVVYNGGAFSAYLNGDFGLQTTGGDSAKWFGVAAAARFPFGAKYAAALRAEFFRDDAGFMTGSMGKLDLISATATGEVKPADGLILRAEGRVDFASEEVFLAADGAKKVQPTFTVGGIAYF